MDIALSLVWKNTRLSQPIVVMRSKSRGSTFKKSELKKDFNQDFVRQIEYL